MRGAEYFSVLDSVHSRHEVKLSPSTALRMEVEPATGIAAGNENSALLSTQATLAVRRLTLLFVALADCVSKALLVGEKRLHLLL